MSHVFNFHRYTIALLSVIAFILSLTVVTSATAQAVVVIANKNFGSSDISAEDLAAVFLGKKSTWSSGEDAVFVVYDDEQAQENFMVRYLQKKPSQFKSYWKKQVFTGKGRMPKYLKSKEDVLQFVENNPGAVSFLPEAAEGAVKILNIR